MNFKKKVSGSWTDVPHYISGTDTETITTLPATIYPLAQTATIGLKGNTVQSGTPTPDNPIMPQGTGERTGNLFDKSTATLGKAMYQNGENVSSSFGHSDYISVNAETQYYLSNVVPVTQFYTCCAYNSAKQFLSYCNLNATAGAITTPQNCKYIIINFIVGKIDDVMVNVGSTALPYEPYGYKIPISSGGVTTNVYLGEVESTRQIKKLVLTGQENWVKDSGNTYAYNISSIRSYYDSICSHYVASYSYSDVIATNNRYAAGKTILFIHDNNYSTAEDFKTYLAQQYAADTPVTVWYVLATPTTGIVNEPLMKLGDYADSISGISIPTTAGANTLDVQTTVKPSEVTANFNGWHPVSSAHERNNGAWT